MKLIKQVKRIRVKSHHSLRFVPMFAMRTKRPFAASAQKSALGLLYAMKTDVFEMPQKEFKGPLPNLLMLDAIQVLGFAAVTIGGGLSITFE